MRAKYSGQALPQLTSLCADGRHDVTLGLPADDSDMRARRRAPGRGCASTLRASASASAVVPVPRHQVRLFFCPRYGIAGMVIISMADQV